MIRKEIRADVGYSVVESDGVRRIFATVAPCRGVTLPEQAESALQTTSIALSGRSEPWIDRDAVGLPEEHRGSSRLPTDRRGVLWARVAGHQLRPPTALRRKTAVDRGLGPCRRQRRPPNRAPHGEEWRSPGTMAPPGPTWPMSVPRPRQDRRYDRSLSAFRAAGERLNSAGWRFDEVIRTWLYLGNITGTEGQTQSVSRTESGSNRLLPQSEVWRRLGPERGEQGRLSRQHGHRRRRRRPG